LSAHQRATIRTSIAGRGAQRFSWPPYSPALAPIERAWSQLKTYWRVAKARTREALARAIQHALTTMTAADAHGWFTHCGYTVS
jgi:transposase